MSEKYSVEDIKRELESENVPEKLEPKNIKIMLDEMNAPKIKRTKKRRSIAMRITSAAAAFAVVIGTSVYFAKSGVLEKNILVQSGIDSSEKNTSKLRVADDYKDVYTYFTVKRLISNIKDGLDGGILYREYGETKSDNMIAGGEDILYEEADSESSAEYVQEAPENENGSVMNDAGGENKENDYSDTYNQENGVLEADIVKTDGKSIYYASGSKVKAAEVQSGSFVNSYAIDLDVQLGNSSLSIEDMYIYGDKLVIISNAYDDYYNYNTCYMKLSSASTCISFYSTNGSLSYIGTYIQEGDYNDVRLTSDGYLYLISNDEKYYSDDDFKRDDIEEYIPQYCVDGTSQYIEPSCIVMPPSVIDDYYDYASYINISGFNLNGGDVVTPSDMKSIAGYSGDIYCSQDNLYVTFGYDDTQITRLSISEGNITPAATGRVKGYTNDQFSMSEYNGYFRIATTVDEWNKRSDIDYDNALYVMDMDLKTVGEISGFGVDETIRSVNFMDNIAYIVTFMQTDPLYAIDMSDPENPVLLDEYKMPGYSTYMQKWSDGLLLGFGVSGDENGATGGLKLTMFDNSDPSDLKEVSSVEIVRALEDDVYYHGFSSEGVYERKALLIDPEKNIIGFPMSETRYGDDYEACASTFEFYSFENGQLTYKGSIKGNSYQYMYYDTGYDYESALNNYSEFRRAVYIDGYIYAVSDTLFKSADMSTISEKDSLVFS